MATHRRLASVALAGLMLATGGTGASAITINGVVSDAGAPGTVAGGGSLSGVFAAVKSFWEAAITDSFLVTINISWGAQSGSTLAAHTLGAQTFPIPPFRETSGSIVVDNDGSTNWFADSTPFDDSEFSTYAEQTADLGGGVMNVGRVFTDATGSAAGRFDLFSVLLHEVGHALGMSASNVAYQQETVSDNDIDLTGSLPHAGASLATNNTPSEYNAHLTTAVGTEVLMQPTIGTGKRRYASAADIEAMCQLSTFTGCNVDVDIPEPASGLAVIAGLGLLGLLRRRAIAS